MQEKSSPFDIKEYQKDSQWQNYFVNLRDVADINGLSFKCLDRKYKQQEISNFSQNIKLSFLSRPLKICKSKFLDFISHAKSVSSNKHLTLK